MIVKVQLSIATTEPVRQVMIYNQDRSIQWQGAASREIRAMMRNSLKEYCYAELVDTRIVLGRKLNPTERKEIHW